MTPSTALEVREAGAPGKLVPVVPRTPVALMPLAEKVRYAELLARASALPREYRNNPANILLAIEYAALLDIHPVTALAHVNIIEGTPSMSAELMRAQVKRAGHRFRILEHTACRAVVEIVTTYDRRHPHVEEFTLDDAVQAELCRLKDGKPYARSNRGAPLPWELYPKAMLLARATSAAVRATCPEVTHGISYIPEELGALVAENGSVLDPPDSAAADDGFPTKADLAALDARVAEMTYEEVAALREWRHAEGISLRPGEFTAAAYRAVMAKTAELMALTDEPATPEQLERIAAIEAQLSADDLATVAAYCATTGTDPDHMTTAEADDVLDVLEQLAIERNAI